MKNIKKKICLLLIFVLSLFVFSSRVDAAVMYMECGDGSDDYFLPIVIRITNGDKTDYAFCGYGELDIDGSVVDDNIPIISQLASDNCWMKPPARINDSCSLGNNTYGDDKNGLPFNIDDKQCPSSIRYSKELDYANIGGTNVRRLVFLGKKEASNVSSIEDDEYVFYKIKDKNGKEIIVGEGFTSDGLYSYFNRGFHLSDDGTSFNKHTAYHLCLRAMEYGRNFWKVSSDFDFRYVAGSYCEDEEDCKNKGYEEILTSADKNGKLLDDVKEWYDQQGNKYTTLSDLENLINDKSFIKSCDNLIDSFEKGKSYSFSDGYNASNLLIKLSSAYELLKEAYELKPYYTNYFTGENDVEIYSSAQTAIFKKYFNTPNFSDLILYDNSTDYILNAEKLRKMITDDVRDLVRNIISSEDSSTLNLIDLYDSLDNYNTKFSKAISYFDYMADNTDLSSDEKLQLSSLKENMSDLAGEHNIFFVVTCEDLISDKLNDKILSYFDIIKIIVQVLLVGFGIVDFAKATFSGDDNEMKKAQKTFVKRLFIAILFFLIPIFVNLLLNIANMVWSNINPNTCIRF